MSAPTVEPLVLSCEHCGAEVQVVGDRTAVDVDMLTEDWNVEHADCSRSSELVHWTTLRQAVPRTLVGLENMIGPRPSWSDPAHDKCDLFPSYGSVPAITHLSLHEGTADGDTFMPATVSVGARLRKAIDGGPYVAMTTHKFYDGKWMNRGTSLTPDEARRHAALLFAAADLAESEPIGGPS